MPIGSLMSSLALLRIRMAALPAVLAILALLLELYQRWRRRPRGVTVLAGQWLFGDLAKFINELHDRTHMEWFASLRRRYGDTVLCIFSCARRGDSPEAPGSKRSLGSATTGALSTTSSWACPSPRRAMEGDMEAVELSSPQVLDLEPNEVGVAAPPADTPVPTDFEVASRQLLEEAYGQPLSEQAIRAMVTSYPEMAWLSQCMIQCPLPEGWFVQDAAGLTRHVERSTGEAHARPPFLPHFARLASLVLCTAHSPQEGGTAVSLAKELRDNAGAHAQALANEWNGPHIDATTGASYYHSTLAGRSCWGDPAACSRYIEQVSQEILMALRARLPGTVGHGARTKTEVVEERRCQRVGDGALSVRPTVAPLDSTAVTALATAAAALATVAARMAAVQTQRAPPQGPFAALANVVANLVPVRAAPVQSVEPAEAEVPAPVPKSAAVASPVQTPRRSLSRRGRRRQTRVDCHRQSPTPTTATAASVAPDVSGPSPLRLSRPSPLVGVPTGEKLSNALGLSSTTPLEAPCHVGWRPRLKPLDAAASLSPQGELGRLGQDSNGGAASPPPAPLLVAGPMSLPQTPQSVRAVRLDLSPAAVTSPVQLDGHQQKAGARLLESGPPLPPGPVPALPNLPQPSAHAAPSAVLALPTAPTPMAPDTSGGKRWPGVFGGA